MTETANQLREEYVFARFRLRSVLITPLVALGMFAIPTVFANMLMVAINLIAVRYEYRFNFINPMSIAMIALGSILLGLNLSWPAFFDSVFFPTIVFAMLFAIGAILAVLGQPFTNFLATSIGDQRLHWMSSLSWTAIYFLCTVVCYFVTTNVGLYFVPVGLVALGAGLTLWLQLCYKVPPVSDGQNASDDLVQPYELTKNTLHEILFFFSRALQETRRERPDRTLQKTEDIVSFQEEHLSDKHLKSLSYFVARDEKGIRGCIRCGEGAFNKLTVEESFPDIFDLNRLRKFGKVVELDHFAIRKDARRSKDLPLALITSAIEHCLAVQAKLIIVEATKVAESLYTRMGCESLYDGALTCAEGFPVKIMFLNLERRILHPASDEGIEQASEGQMRMDIIERYTKRSAFRSIFLKRAMHSLSAQDIRSLALSNTDDQVSEVGPYSGKSYG